MQAYLLAQYPDLTILAWDDPEETPFVVIHEGVMILADSLALLIAELQSRTHLPLMLAA